MSQEFHLHINYSDVDLRLFREALVVEVGLPEARGSITGGEGREAVRVHLDGQRLAALAAPVVLLVEPLGRGQADHPGSDYRDAHAARIRSLVDTYSTDEEYQKKVTFGSEGGKGGKQINNKNKNKCL